MTSPFTLGIEEEYQLVDRTTGQLVSHIHPILDKGTPLLGDKIKPEMLQSTIEIITDVCPNIIAMRHELQQLVASVCRIVEDEGLALMSSGTHPCARWRDQIRTRNERYAELEEEYQDVGRSILIFAVHVHVGLPDYEFAIPLLNQLRTWLPHLLALSSNSPFWEGRYTGLKSYRAIVWKRFLRSGVPEVFSSTTEFESYVHTLIRTGCIDNGKRIWWDIRPHPFFKTLEFRVCDMPGTLEDTLAIAALCQALVAKLSWMYERNMMTPILPRNLIEENKWRAMRRGLEAELVDFVHYHSLPMREAIGDLLDFVDDMVDELQSRREISYLRALLVDPRGTGADRQIAVYQESGSQQAVANFLMQQTMQGIALDSARAS